MVRVVPEGRIHGLGSLDAKSDVVANAALRDIAQYEYHCRAVPNL
jgi:hypothetical protein